MLSVVLLMTPRRSRSALLLAMLGLIAQLALGGFVPSSVDLFAMQAMPVCSGDAAGHSAPAAPGKHWPGLPPSPFCTAMFAGALQLPVPPALPAPVVAVAARPELPPPATAPPAGFRLAAHPRGPPAFLT